MTKRQVDALTIKAGPVEDGLAGSAPTPTPVPTTDVTTSIVVAVVVVAVVVISVATYLWRRKKTPTKQ